MEEFLIKARELAYNESEKTRMPASAHVDIATKVGKRLAGELRASIDIVEAGTLLMDCALGRALKENRLPDHVQMSLDRADEILENSSLSEKEKENIRHCILEHHGVCKFYSIESEICCNADCYRFISIKGFAFAIRYLRDMSFGDLVKILKEKADEKWNALSLDICKKELTPQHQTITEMLKYLSEEEI